MSRYAYGYGDWDPYVPVGERKRLAEQEAKRRLKKGQSLAPIRITARKIATTFWGIAWCDNLDHYSDFANRLPRGRTYARNGSIVDLQIKSGKITALVAGSSPYDVNINIKKLDAKKWNQLRLECAESIHSLIDLMRGKLPDEAMRCLTAPKTGMFPTPSELSLSCNCPDGAGLCKHLAAVLYGVGHRLDSEPELFFRLRGVHQQDLISHALSNQSVDAALGLDQESDIDNSELGAMFGIDLAVSEVAPKATTKKKSKKKSKKKRTATASKKTGKKKLIKKKAVKSKASRSQVMAAAPKKGSAKKKTAKRKLPTKKRAVSS